VERSTVGCFVAHTEVAEGLAHVLLLSGVHSAGGVLGHSVDNTLEHSSRASMAVASTSGSADLDMHRKTSTAGDCGAGYACAGVSSRYESVVFHSLSGRLHLQSGQ
jgi:hypothetical protein